MRVTAKQASYMQTLLWQPYVLMHTSVSAYAAVQADCDGSVTWWLLHVCTADICSVQVDQLALHSRHFKAVSSPLLQSWTPAFAAASPATSSHRTASAAPFGGASRHRCMLCAVWTLAAHASRPCHSTTAACLHRKSSLLSLLIQYCMDQHTRNTQSSSVA